MIINNYSINTCRYRIDKLDKVVYMVSKESLGKISASEYFIDGCAQALVIKCNSVSLTETTSLDERFQFSHSLTFQVDGYKTEGYFFGRYYAIVKDMDGVYYLVNPEFKMKATYTYTIDSTNEYTEFTLSTISNYPLMRIDNFAPWANANFTSGSSIYKWVNVTPTSDRNSYICDFIEDNSPCKPYSRCGLDTIMLNERAYTTYCEGDVFYSNTGFKNIEYIKNSATFTETFNGNTISHQLKFSIPYDSSSWHSFLLDFPHNKYSMVLTTKCINVGCGFTFGLIPSYSLSGSNSESDRIEITLDGVDNGERIIYSASPIPIISQ